MKLKLILIPILSLTVFVTLSTAQDKTEKSTSQEKTTTVKKKVLFTKNGERQSHGSGEAPEVGILLEYISLDHKKANELIGKFVSKAGDIQELRDNLDQMIDKKNAELVETVWIRGRSGHRAKTESVRQDYYPTFYAPPVLLGKKNSSAKEPEIQMTASMPGTFEMRNVGTTLEVDPLISSDHSLIEISLSPEIVTRLKDTYYTRKDFEKTAWGVENILMPNFYTIKDTCQIEVAPGKYNLLGIHTPHDDPEKKILVLLRADLISFD